MPAGKNKTNNYNRQCATIDSANFLALLDKTCDN